MLKDLYVSFMSGNTTSLGLATAAEQWPRAALTGGILTTFVVGSAIGTVVAIRVGRGHLPVVVLLVAALLVIAATLRSGAIWAMALAMGALNASMQHAGPVNVSVTYVTGTLVRLGQGLGRLACGEQKDWTWLEQAVPWTGLLLGAAATAVLLARYGAGVFWMPPVAAVVLAATILVAARSA